MELGEILKKLRLENRYTQKQLAEHLQINQVTYSTYERGRNFPTQDTLLKFAEFYQVSLDYLLGKTNVRHAELSSDLAALWMAQDLQDLPPDALIEIHQYVEFIKQKYAAKNSQK